jgi:hypothetical protein
VNSIRGLASPPCPGTGRGFTANRPQVATTTDGATYAMGVTYDANSRLSDYGDSS